MTKYPILKTFKATLCAGFLLSPTQTFSAEIILTPNPIMGCFATLSGPIQAGDTEKVEAQVEAVRNSEEFRFSDGDIFREKGRVCLSSPGGSLSEGVKLATYFNSRGVGTAVARGESCLSACAAAFMGGSIHYENDWGTQPDRVLHPRGKLGFHAPSLGVTAGQYDETAVNKSYSIALESLASLLEISADIVYPTTLVTKMLATHPTDMHIVSTVGEAGIWQIAIAPVKEPRTLTKKGVINTCEHIDAAALDERWGDGSSFAPIKVTQGGTGSFTGEMEEGFRQERATGCSMNFSAAGKNQAGRTLPSGSGYIADFYVATWPYQTYGPEIKIASLALKNDNRVTTRKTPDKRIKRIISGVCVVFKGVNITDSDPCQLTQVARLTEELVLHETNTFAWPSGAKTVVENISDTTSGNVSTKLNGAKTERDLAYKNQGIEQIQVIRDFAMSRGNPDPLVVCWPNPKTGNRFCFLDNKPSDQSAFFKGFNE